MTLQKPYPHMYRNGSDGAEKAFTEMRSSAEAKSSQAAYRLLISDLRKLFESIEPTSQNKNTFSHRTYELLLRACTEVESNFKIIFTKNQASPDTKNITGYSDLEGPMKLSEYEVLPWNIDFAPFKPFDSFLNHDRRNRSPAWYQSYNNVKHNRATCFSEASFENVIYAIGAVYVLIDAQFGTGYGLGTKFDQNLIRSFAPAHNDVFLLSDIPTWSSTEEYADFDWHVLKTSGVPYDYCTIAKRP